MSIFHRLTVCIASLVAAGSASALQAATPSPQSAYDDNCSACHQPTGRGVKGVFPPLAGAASVNGDPAALVQLILAGRNGMPAFRNDLDDAQIAIIASHIRRAWGNGAKPVTTDFVAKVRARTRNQAVKGNGSLPN